MAVVMPRAADSATKPMHVEKTWTLTFTKLFFDQSDFICHHLVTCKPRLVNSGASRHCSWLLHQMLNLGNFFSAFDLKTFPFVKHTLLYDIYNSKALQASQFRYRKLHFYNMKTIIISQRLKTLKTKNDLSPISLRSKRTLLMSEV